MITEVKLPELGENIESAEVLAILVEPGAWVEKDQPVMELETDKATAEVPAEISGVVVDVRVKEGDKVRVGQTILTLETDGEAASTPTTEITKTRKTAGNGRGQKARPAKTAVPHSGEGAVAQPGDRGVALPGDKAVAPPTEGSAPPPIEDARARPGEGAASRPGERAVSRSRETENAPAVKPPALSLVTDAGSRTPTEPGTLGEVVPAAPSVRRLARELGIDVDVVPGSGPGGRITEDDVKNFARRLIVHSGIAPVPSLPSGIEGEMPELPDFSLWGEVEREPASKVRRVTAQVMALSWSVIPHVTQFDRADVTELEDWRRRHAPRVEATGGKLTVTAIAVKVLASALKVFPKFNASYDARQEEIVFKKFVNVGVAVDTEHGLLVPVIRNADQKNIVRIAGELGDLAERARTRKIAAEELQGGNMNLSNLGGLGTTYFSPIIQWPQVAVLGLGRASTEAVWRESTFAPRLHLPLSVSYDHRLIDGADAARFLRWIAEALEEPMLLALEG